MEVSALTLFGLLMVYSASMVVADHRGNPAYYFVRQSLYAAVGYVFMILLMFFDYHLWLKQRTITFLATLSAATLILVFSQPSTKGSHRFLDVGPISFQPSEIAKLMILFYLAFYLQNHQPEVQEPRFRPLACLMFLGLFVGLIGIEPDFGQAFFIIVIAFLLFFIAGLDRRYLRRSISFLVPAFFLFILISRYRRGRVSVWLDALLHVIKAPYHARHSGIAVGRGGLIGVGFGNSRQKFLFLPEAFGDFIYAVIGEEFGLIGSVLIAAAFLGYLYWGVKISIKAPDTGGLYLGLGITLMVTLQAFIHISSVLSIIPTKGLTLPFISQGGSSLFVCLLATGILFNISSQRKTNEG